MAETIEGLKRTRRCAEFSEGDIGSNVTVMGWVGKKRDLGGVIFVDLRDRSGILQVVFYSSKDEALFNKAESLRNEYVVAIKGEIVRRAPETVNPKIPTGYIEVSAVELRILGKSETPPIYIEEDTDINETLRLRYRYLDLRRPDMQNCFMLRHNTVKLARDYFDKNGFLEIETPMLTKSTPEGARDFLVPSRLHEGKFYALPQSPQLFKQLLMLSGFDRYIQVVRCFRDEDLRADRQLEFTQIDLEMSFVDREDVIDMNEGFICRLFDELLGVKLQRPFTRLTYREAMDRFGSDKPDMRFGLELCDISGIVTDCGFKVFSDTIKNGGSVRVLNARGCAAEFSRREIDGLVEYAKSWGAKGMAWIAVEADGVKSAITKYLTEDEVKAILDRTAAAPGDLICFISDKDDLPCTILGQLRLELARRLKLIDPDKGNGTDVISKPDAASKPDADKYKFLWVTDFPLLEYSQEEKRWVAMHHPFTSPIDEDMHLLDSDPAKVRAKAYDIVLNGVEVGGGSIRIHDQELQRKMFKLLGFTEEEALERFGFLIEAFRYGAPPHGGIAYGLDRLVMMMAGRSSIRDVIAFPKVQNGSCLLTGAPDTVEPVQLRDLHIRTVTTKQ